MCAVFEEYEEVTKMIPLNFMDYDVTWVASKLSGATGTLRVKAIELQNWRI